MNERPGSRVEALLDLIEMRRPAVDAIAFLGSLPWDAPEELVELRRTHVLTAIARCLDGSLSPEELRFWAESIEGREDIGHASGEVDLREVLFELATPELFGDPVANASELLERLGN